MKKVKWLIALLSILILESYCFAKSNLVRIKDSASIRGFRSNQVMGFGLVIGLAKTGDSTASVTTLEAAQTLLNKLGVPVKQEHIVPGNFASVIITADLPPFAKIGDRIDVRISANGDAQSLAGGTLLSTPLQAGDGKVYIMASGHVAVGQASGSGTQVLTVATVPNGGVIEREHSISLVENNRIFLNLKRPDFTNNTRVIKVINNFFRGFYAESIDPSTVSVEIPPQFKYSLIDFISELENLKVEIDNKAIVVLNERTGTVVLGNHVTINPITIAHGDLSIQIEDQLNTNSLVGVEGTTVALLVKSLNTLGVTPNDLVGILQALKAADALNGELKFL